MVKLICGSLLQSDSYCLKSYYVSLILYVTVDRPGFLGVTQGCSETGWLP